MNDQKENQWLQGGLVAIVIVHCLVALWHGVAHVQVPVPLTGLQTAFVGVVIIVLPLLGVGLLWTKRKRDAALVITVSMLASLLFGFFNHYVLDSSDNVLALPVHASSHTFVVSAALLVVTETLGTALGAIAALKWPRAVDVNRADVE
jgi:hypothetical protein